MKNRLFWGLVLLQFIFTPILIGQVSYQLEKGTMTIKGTSSLHDWESSVTEVNVNGNFIFDTNNLEDVQNLKVEIPVKKIKSDRGSNIMDKKTWGALKSDKHPTIKYVLKEVTAIDKKAGNYLLNTRGQLTIAGTTKTVNITATARLDANQKLEIRGEKALKMTDFNIDPPTALLGTLTTGDDVTIVFDITLTKSDNLSLKN